MRAFRLFLGRGILLSPVLSDIAQILRVLRENPQIENLESEEADRRLQQHLVANDVLAGDAQELAVDGRPLSGKLGRKADFIICQFHHPHILALAEGVPILILLVIALEFVTEIAAAADAGIDVHDRLALIFADLGVKLDRIELVLHLRNLPDDVGDPFRRIPFQVDGILEGQLPGIAAAARQTVQAASAVVAVAQIDGQAVAIGVIGLADAVNHHVIHRLLHRDPGLFRDAALDSSAGQIVQVPHLGGLEAIRGADGVQILSESRRIRNQADDLLHIGVEGLRHLVDFAQVDQREGQAFSVNVIVTLGIQNLGCVTDNPSDADGTAFRFIVQALKPLFIVASKAGEGFLRGRQIVRVGRNGLRGLKACHEAGVRHHEIEMDTAVFQRAAQSIETHKRIIVQLVRNEARGAAAAVIPQDQHVLLRRIIFGAPLDIVGERRMLCHAGKLLLIHEMIALAVPAPALQPVRGDVHADGVFRLPALRTAGLDQHVDILVGLRIGDHFEVCGGHAAARLQIRPAEIDHHGPRGRILRRQRSRRFFRSFRRFFRSFRCFFCRRRFFRRRGFLRRFRLSAVCQCEGQHAAQQAQNQHEAEPF